MELCHENIGGKVESNGVISWKYRMEGGSKLSYVMEI